MTYRPEDHDELVSVANALADAARAVILPYFRSKDLTAENKLTTGFDPVTHADKAGQMMRYWAKNLAPNPAPAV
jgi:fructose-1,6-bisphosphatase/inositol monophosphatase family enzyme